MQSTEDNTTNIDDMYKDDLDEKSEYTESTKFTNWANEPTVEDLKKDLIEGRSAHEAHIVKLNVWLDNLRITGQAKRKKVPGRSSISPKLIRKQAEWRYASLSESFLSTEDMFDISPVTFEDKKSAEQNQLVLNNQFSTKIDKVGFVDELIRALVDEGTVIIRTGWAYETIDIEVEVQKIQTEDGETYSFEEAEKLGIQSGTVVIAIEIQEKVTENKPTLDICPLQNLIIDPTCEGILEDAAFVIYSFETSLAKLKKEGKYKFLDKIQTTNDSSVLADPDHVADQHSAEFNFADKPRKKMVAYEYWGLWDTNNTGTVQPIIATWVGGQMIRLELNPFPDQKNPFTGIQYLPVRKSVYGEPDGELLEDNQKVIGAVTRGMIDIMGRGANGQTGMQKGALDITNRRKFEKGLDYEFNGGINPRDSFHQHIMSEIPQSAEAMINMQQNEADSLSGVKSFSKGISGAALGTTATGVRSALDATAKRELGILRRVANGITKIGRKVISMNSEFLSDIEVIRITNEEFIEVRRDDLAGDIDLRLTVSTAEVDNEKAQELSFMLQTLGPNQDPEITKMIQVDIAKLRKMPELAKRLEEYVPQPDPLAVKKAELEIALLEAQVFNENAKGKENEIDSQLKLARARNLDSKSDTEDLDFLDKQSGAGRQHELDMKGADRDAQLDLKIADKQLETKKDK